jgi:uncharacterized phage-like protein YoqJ
MKACSFTGHRQIKREHEKELPNLVARAVKYAYEEGCRRFIAGGALGFDTLVAREVIKFRMHHPDVSLVLYLPCIAQDTKWKPQQKRLYEYLLSEADEVVYVSEEYTDGCMKERNRRIAEDADMLIAYVARTNSGAAQTVRMARELGREIYNLYPALERDK